MNEFESSYGKSRGVMVEEWTMSRVTSLLEAQDEAAIQS